MTTRLRQVLVLALGVLLAAAMVVLGLWQLDVYRSQGASAAAARAAAPPVDLRQVAPVGAGVVDGFGRSVHVEGSYDPALQLLVPVADDPTRFRVLSGLRQSDGSLVAVVRGVLPGSPGSDPATPPAPPADAVSEVGVLLPSEDDAPGASEDGNNSRLGAVRLPSLAQRWSPQLVGGYVTLGADASRAQGLEPAPLKLPEGQGRLRNGAYALQWWVFAVFAVWMAVRIARDLGIAEQLASGETQVIAAEPVDAKETA